MQNPKSLTPIQQFYSGSNILITGGTGFLGKLLINKLLHSCSNINRIYLLVREKKGKDVQSRIESIFEDPIFDIKPNRHKLHCIAGDCILPGLGISENDKKELVKNVNIVIHMAATVRFDEKLNVAMKINIQGCIDLVHICSEMKHLKSFLHVSTAYTQCPLQYIEERFYSPPMEPEKLLALSKCVTDEQMKSITPILVGKWPNAYSFTKAIAEDVFRAAGNGMPIGMIRPGIVISTYKDPVSGWIDNFYGPTGIIAGIGTGVIRIVQNDVTKRTNFVPADLCINGIIAAAWDVSNRFEAKSSLAFEKPVYNFCMAPTNPLTFRDYGMKNKIYVSLYPSIKMIWHFSYRKTACKWEFLLGKYCLHYLPALLVDAIAIVIGQKAKFIDTYKRIHRHMDLVDYFLMRQWDFQLDTINGLWTSLSPRDKEIFYFDMRTLDWDNYFETYFLGIRKYLLKDPIETLPKALVRFNRLNWADTILKSIFFLLVVLFVWTIFL